MSLKTALPLSQQVMAWILQSMGRIEKATVSRSTIKSGMRGKIIHSSWQNLIEDGLKCLNIQDIIIYDFKIFNFFRDIDKEIASIDTCKLDQKDLMIILLYHLAPEMGKRLGALIAFIRSHRNGDSNIIPDLELWLLEPLSRRVMGRIIEGLLRFYWPDLKTWDQRYEKLEKLNNGTLNQRTVERWRSPSETFVPKVNHIKNLAKEICKNEEDQNRAGFFLGLGRLLMEFRRLLEFLITSDQVNIVESEMKKFAQRECDEISKNSVLSNKWEEIKDIYFEDLKMDEVSDSNIQNRLVMIFYIFKYSGFFLKSVQLDWKIMSIAKAISKGEAIRLDNIDGEEIKTSDILRGLASNIVQQYGCIIRCGLALTPNLDIETQNLDFYEIILLFLQIFEAERQAACGKNLNDTMKDVGKMVNFISSAMINADTDNDDFIIQAPFFAPYLAYQNVQKEKSDKARELLNFYYNALMGQNFLDILRSSGCRINAALTEFYIFKNFRYEIEKINDYDNEIIKKEKNKLIYDQALQVFQIIDCFLSSNGESIEQIERIICLLPVAILINRFQDETTTDEGQSELRISLLINALHDLINKGSTHPGLRAWLAAVQWLGEENGAKDTLKEAIHLGGQFLIEEIADWLRPFGNFDQICR